MDRADWLSSLRPGARVLLESTDPRVPSRVVRIATVSGGAICADGIRFNVHGKRAIGPHVWSLVPILPLVGLLEAA